MGTNNYLVHYGIQGQKWGVRNYQNYDGSLTYAGRMRYGKLGNRYDKIDQKISRYEVKRDKALAKGKEKKAGKIEKKISKGREKLNSLNEEFGDLTAAEIRAAQSFRRSRNTGLAIATVAFGIPGAAVYTAYKHSQYKSERRAVDISNEAEKARRTLYGE